MKNISLITLLLLLTATQDLLPMNFNLGSNKTPREYAIIITEEIKQRTDVIETLEREALISRDQFNQPASKLQTLQEAQDRLKTAKEKTSQSITTKQNMVNNYLIPMYTARELILNGEQETMELMKNKITIMQTKIDDEMKLLEPLEKIVGFTLKKSDPEMEAFCGRIVNIAAYISIIGLIGWCVYFYKSHSGTINYLLFKRA